MLKKFILLILAIQFGYPAAAVEKISITQGVVDPIPVAVTKLHGETGIWNDIAEVVMNDLEHSGLFRIIDNAAFLEKPSVSSVPMYSNWRKINAAALLVGRAEEISGDMIKVDFRLWDPFTESQIGSMSYKVSSFSWRRVGHKIADVMFKNITGEEGYFDSRVLYVSEAGSRASPVLRLALMDQDGENVKTLTDGKYMVLSPRFDYKTQRVIYMSYQNKVPKVFILDLATGKQKLIGNFPGMSFAPRFSPDGQYAVMSVAKDGTTDIYELDLQTGMAAKLTHGRGIINTSPSYSPDGSKIVFNSDRGGGRKLYVMNRDGSSIKRISFGEGSYAEPVWSPKGDYIAFTKIKGGQFSIGVMRPDGNGERILTTSWQDEGPTWAPNGRVIMFERKRKGGRSGLYAIDITGYHERRIPTPTAASNPAWSPLLD